MEPLWQIRLRRVQERFVEAARSNSRCVATVVQFAHFAGSADASTLPLSDKFGLEVIAETNLANRDFAILSDTPGERTYLNLAKAAGECLTDVPPEIDAILWDGFRGKRLTNPSWAVWTNALFELGWLTNPQKFRRLAWVGNFSVPIEDLEELRKRKGPPFEQYLAHIPDPPERWFSHLDDLLRRSADAIDLLFSLAETAPVPTRDTSAATKPSVDPEKLLPFAGGKMEFFEDRVELCGVEICQGSRCKVQRDLLKVLSRKEHGKFKAYSIQSLVKQLNPTNEKFDAAGCVKALRNSITRNQRKKGSIICGREDVIVIRGPGYRLAEWITINQSVQSEPVSATPKACHQCHRSGCHQCHQTQCHQCHRWRRNRTPSVDFG